MSSASTSQDNMSYSRFRLRLCKLGQKGREIERRVVVLSWNAGAHIRGKTTDKSRGGSFAPKIDPMSPEGIVIRVKEKMAARKAKEDAFEKNERDKLIRLGVIKDYTGTWSEDTRPEEWYWMKSVYPLSPELVDKLNMTGKFDSTGSKSARRLRGAIDKWVTGGTSGNEQMSDNSSRGMVSYALSLSKTGRAPELFRGIADEDFVKEYSRLAVGHTISIPPTSWSSSREVALGFGTPMGGNQKKSLMLSLGKGARALNVSKYAGKYEPQKEWVAGGGLFEVTSKSVSVDGTVLGLRYVR